ncbi:hypothetical protein [Bradyrhizobium sp. CCBAU 51753]|uniref:hypothetical protein n=1 Tax=Bradyrhizobium sp. CCBAU 51753 TaxID=1325100 RepID=UPI00188D6409|nr:hypothetical protein [Bradyrhizobium sp. CCBAU 51753]QOZ25264.1 hypothetical protein XH93_17970 [Bradyrhizobium sp. CCBAU 51753]
MTQGGDQRDLSIDFDTEARIIAKNETHTVLAVRVENAVFTRNAVLMAALANIILLGEPDPNTPPGMA